MAKLDDIQDNPAPYWCVTCGMELSDGQVAYHKRFGHKVVAQAEAIVEAQAKAPARGGGIRTCPVS